MFQGNFAQFGNILGRDVEYLSQSFESFAYLFVVVFHNQHFLWWVNQLGCVPREGLSETVEYSLKTCDKVIHLSLCEAQRGQYAQDVGAGAACEAMLLVDET